MRTRNLLQCLLLSASTLANADSIPTQGDWIKTLLPRDVNGDGTVDAYYDTVQDLTWVLNADRVGPLTWQNAQAYAANITALGVSGWRLPSLTESNPTMFSRTASELSRLYYFTLGNHLPSYGIVGGLQNTGPFTNLRADEYWLADEYSPTEAWVFGMGSGLSWTLEKTPFHPDLYSRTFLVKNGDFSPPPVPKIYGLFIGANDGNFAFKDHAIEMANTFASVDPKNRIPFTLTGNVESSPISISEIGEKLDMIRLRMTTADSLVIYINNHGASQIQTLDPQTGTVIYHYSDTRSAGDEIIRVGALGGENVLSDNKLTDMLRSFDSKRKLIFLDSCVSGGFWGSNDTAEQIGIDDLNQLKNISLFAAAAEGMQAFAPFEDKSFFGMALQEAMGMTGTSFSAESLAEYLDTRSKEIAKRHLLESNPVFFSLGLGDTVLGSTDLVASTARFSADFNISTPVLSVPEVNTLLMLSIGLLIVGGTVRRNGVLS